MKQCCQLVILGCLTVSRATFSLNADQALTEFRTQFITPYKSVITTLANEVLKPLADAPIPNESDTLAINATFQTFVYATHRLHSGLISLNAVLTSHKAQLDSAIETITIQRGAKEREMTEKEQAIAVITAQVNTKQREQVIAQQQLDSEMQSVNGANDVVARAEESVHNARHCIVKGGGWFKKAINGVCHIGSRVNNAKADRSRAEQHRDAAQRHLEQAIVLVVNLEAERSRLVGENKAIQSFMGGLMQATQRLKGETVRATEVQGLMAGVVTHVAALLGPSGDLVGLVQRLGELENVVVVPLEAIGERVVMYVHDPAVVAEFRTLQDSIRTSMPVVKAKLAQYPLFF